MVAQWIPLQDGDKGGLEGAASSNVLPREGPHRHRLFLHPSVAPTHSPSVGKLGDGRRVTLGTLVMPARAQSSVKSCSRRPVHWYSSAGRAGRSGGT